MEHIDNDYLNHAGNDNIMERLKVENITERCRKVRLGWFGQVNRTTKILSEDKHWRWYHLGEEEVSGPEKMKAMTELVGGDFLNKSEKNESA